MNKHQNPYLQKTPINAIIYISQTHLKSTSSNPRGSNKIALVKLSSRTSPRTILSSKSKTDTQKPLNSPGKVKFSRQKFQYGRAGSRRITVRCRYEGAFPQHRGRDWAIVQRWIARGMALLVSSSIALDRRWGGGAAVSALCGPLYDATVNNAARRRVLTAFRKTRKTSWCTSGRNDARVRAARPPVNAIGERVGCFFSRCSEAWSSPWRCAGSFAHEVSPIPRLGYRPLSAAICRLTAGPCRVCQHIDSTASRPSFCLSRSRADRQKGLRG